MKIAILDMDNLKNPFWGSGQARVTREIFKRLAAKHEVTVYCSRYPGNADYVEEGIKYVHIGLGSNFARLNNLAYLLAQVWTARKINVDIILENFTAPIATGFIPLFTKIPVIAVSSFFAADAMTKKYGINFESVTKIGIKYYKFAICLAPEQQKKVLSLNPEITTTVIPNGVDSSYFNRSASEKNYILFMGRIDIEHKGLDLLFEAYAKVADTLKDNLYIMGSGTNGEQNRLRELISKFKLDSRVRLLGKLDGEDKLQCLAECKFMVCPSRHESQNLSSLEAMAMGKPLVCFNIPGLEWIPTRVCLKAEMKAEKFSTAEYGALMLRMAQDPQLRRDLGLESKQFARAYDWNNSAEKYDQFFKQVLDFQGSIKGTSQRYGQGPSQRPAQSPTQK